MLAVALTPWSVAYAGLFFDATGRVALETRLAPASTSGYVATLLYVRPTSATDEVSSIDAASGGHGFFADELRQVNPFGAPTIFSDLNESFASADRPLGDSQFLFAGSSLILISQTLVESTTTLRAEFTGFPPFRIDAVAPFAQLIMPWSGRGMFRGAFAVRPVGGGAPQLANFPAIEVGLGRHPADFDGNGTLDGGDVLTWQRTFGQTSLEPFAPADADGDALVAAADLQAWREALSGQAGIPRARRVLGEPATPATGLLFLLVAWRRVQRCPPERLAAGWGERRAALARVLGD